MREKADKARSGIGSPPFSFMNANQPLEEKWAVNFLNRCTATQSLYRGPMIGNKIENYLLKDPEDGGDIKEVIAEQALSTLVPCTLPLKDLLQVKLGLWTKMSRKLYFPKLQVEAKPPGIP